MSSTRVSHHINAPRDAVYRALLDPRAVATWRVPTGMTSHVHEFDAREGGSFRVSLTYDAQAGAGKTTAHTDTYRAASRSSCRTSRLSKSSSSRRQIPSCAAR